MSRAMRSLALLWILSASLLLVGCPPTPEPEPSKVTVKIGTTSGGRGQTVTVPVTVEVTKTTATLQFDVEFDGLALEFIDAQSGPAANGRNAMSSLIRIGHARILLVGVTDKPIQNGTLANLRFRISDKANSGADLELDGTAPITSDLLANLIPTDIEDGSISVN